MAESDAESEAIYEIAINVANLQARAFAKLQRSLDILRFARASARSAKAADYESSADFFNVEPAQNMKMSFDAAREAAEEWFTLNVVRDAIDIIGDLLDESRFTLSLLRLTQHPNPTGVEFNQAKAERKVFHELGLPKKLDELSAKFGVTSDTAEHFLSVNRARNCLVHRLGIVSAKDVGGAETLVVTWLAPKIEVSTTEGEVSPITKETIVPPGSRVSLQLGVVSRTFALGERIAFTYTELIQQQYSLMMFINSLVSSIEEFAKGVGFVFEDPDAAT